MSVLSSVVGLVMEVVGYSNAELKLGVNAEACDEKCKRDYKLRSVESSLDVEAKSAYARHQSAGLS